MSDYIASMKKGFSQVDANIKKGFSQVIRTSSVSGNSDVLDPLSIFVSQAQVEKEVVETNSNDSSKTITEFKLDSDYFGANSASPVSSLASQNNPVSQRKAEQVSSSITKSSEIHSKGPLSSVEHGDDDSVRYLTGEQKIMSLVDASIQTTPGHFITGTLLMTNYRISFLPKHSELRDICATNPSVHSWLQIPLAAIDRLDREKKAKNDYSSSGVNFTIFCKDFRQHRITIKSAGSGNPNGDYDIERAISVLTAYAFPNNMRYLFAFSHSLASAGQLVQPVPQYDAMLEFSRMGVLDSSLWRMTSANCEFKLCGTYCRALVVPRGVSDEDLHVVASFRSGHRLPTLCWADRLSGTSMWRCSQPKAGVSGSCLQDEKLLDHLAKSCVSTTRGSLADHKRHPHNREPLLHIVDLRSRASAMANRAAGAGYESQANYPASRLEFYNIPNIHGVRDSLKALAAVALNPSANAAGDLTFSKQVDDSQWLTNLRLVLKASWETARFMSRGQPVLVHCSHGWDRTAQVCALAQLLLDPYYRTLAGFQVLVEKEWVSFGHPFQMRCGHAQDRAARQEDQVSPIFLQFLDCVWQVQRQHCQYFEFNSRYLLAIADHIYSGRFGTFLFSNDHDRELYGSRQQCADLWTYLHCNRACFANPLYMHSASTSGLVASLPLSAPSAAKFALLLPPLTQMLRNVTLWSEYFLRWSSVASALFAPTVLSKQLYYNGLCRPLYFPPSDTAYSGDVALLQLERFPEKDSDAKAVPAKSGALCTSGGDLEVAASVTSDDFWEGAYRLERETRIRAQEAGTQLRASQAAMVDRLKSFLFEKALDLSEDDLNAVLGIADVAATSHDACSDSAACGGQVLIAADPPLSANASGDFAAEIAAADSVADDLLQERGYFDPAAAAEEEEEDYGIDDSLPPVLDEEPFERPDDSYSPLPLQTDGPSAAARDSSGQRQPSAEQSFFV